MADLPTPELKAMKAFMDSTGVPYRITSTTGDQHAKTSWHYKGLAADFAEKSPSADTPGLLAIFTVWLHYEKTLTELIYAGAPFQIKNGKRVTASFYGAQTMSIHHNHVHVAVPTGFRWSAPVVLPEPTKKVHPMFDPPIVLEPLVAELRAPGGGVWLLAASGAIYAFGGAPHHGGANGKDYFAGRKAARLEPREDGGYDILDETGARYQYPPKI